jgi:N,N-dimethylformamidase
LLPCAANGSALTIRPDAGMRIVGYTDPLTVSAGEQLDVMVSTTEPRYTASLVRLPFSPDRDGASGPVISEIQGEHEGREHAFELGSYVVVDDPTPLRSIRQLTFCCWVWPTRVGKSRQAIVAYGDATAESAWQLCLSDRGDLAVLLSAGMRVPLRTENALRERNWYFVALRLDLGADRVALTQLPLRHWPNDPTCSFAEGSGSGLSRGWPPSGRLAMAAQANGIGPRDPASAHFNGKIEAPAMFSAWLRQEDLQAIASGTCPAEINAPLLADWEFRPSTDLVISDRTGGGLSGRLINGPTRAVTGHAWKGDEIDWRNAPEDYAAIHFHDDDLDDAGWEPAIRFGLPRSTPSGIYAIQLRTSTGYEDCVPFFVTPLPGTEHPPVAFLVPTFSYLAYGNESSSWTAPTFEIPGLSREEVQQRIGCQDRFIADERLLSLYERHSDGSGTCMSSRRRPIVNMRPAYHMPLIGSPHQFSADLELVEWLGRQGIEHDILSDELLHREGTALLSAYRVILLGSHPEYWSRQMLDALDSYLDDGGRVMYLGGNGLYWVTSVDPVRPWVIEVRRGHAGTRSWECQPGEVHHQSTGEPGGLWRHRGRPPQTLLGVGFTAQGFDRSLPYRATPAASSSRAAFIFNGVNLDQSIGDQGKTLGGAAGFEIDRCDPSLGTPPHALSLAMARGYSSSYQAAVEETLVTESLDGDSASARVHSDMVYFECANGGAVFSVGSIAWCGALGANADHNPVSRITGNVLRAFANGDAPHEGMAEPAATEASIGSE